MVVIVTELQELHFQVLRKEKLFLMLSQPPLSYSTFLFAPASFPSSPSSFIPPPLPPSLMISPSRRRPCFHSPPSSSTPTPSSFPALLLPLFLHFRPILPTVSAVLLRCLPYPQNPLLFLFFSLLPLPCHPFLLFTPPRLPTYQPAIRGDPVLRTPREGWADPRQLWLTLLMAGTREREVSFVVPQGCMQIFFTRPYPASSSEHNHVFLIALLPLRHSLVYVNLLACIVRGASDGSYAWLSL